MLAALKGRSVLTVGDFEGFARRGGIIRFVTVGNKIRLRVNLAAAQEAKLDDQLETAAACGDRGVGPGLSCRMR